MAPEQTVFPARTQERLDSSRVAHLATVRPDGRPHVVPVTFALVGGHVVMAVDEKPKRTHDLQRLRNIAAHPEVSLLVDRYDEDWTRLWWVRLDGPAEVVTDEPLRSELLEPLVAKYAQYRTEPPRGPVVRVTVARHTSWEATS